MATDSSHPTVYFDHAATSWPKPEPVVEAVVRSLTELGGNPGRGAYRLAIDTARMVHDARRSVAAFLGVPDARDVSFQPSCTYALNLALLGLVRPGDRVVTTSVEHNAVARPLAALRARGVDLAIVPARADGTVAPDAVAAALAEAPTRALVVQHAGNLSGAIQPVRELACLAHDAGALAIVDGAQAGGHLPVDLAELGVDAWACSGHKGLLGPQGIGVLWLAPDCDPEPLVTGGTGGGASEAPTMPAERPDRYEPGTLNVPGIAGLGAAARFLAEHALAQREDEARLTRRLHQGVLGIAGLRVLGPALGEARVPVLSLVHDRLGADRIAQRLDRDYGIGVRAGLHCAPWAHESLGTLGTGAVRFGIGYGNTAEQIDLALAALAEICGAV